MLHTRLPDRSPTAKVSTHVALELWRLAAVLRFCTVPELRLATSSLCVLIFTARVLEALARDGARRERLLLALLDPSGARRRRGQDPFQPVADAHLARARRVVLGEQRGRLVRVQVHVHERKLLDDERGGDGCVRVHVDAKELPRLRERMFLFQQLSV